MRLKIGIACLAMLVVYAHGANAQRRTKTKETLPKNDFLTLRYKPQAGTLLYNIRTDISQRVRDERSELNATVHTSAQLAIHNVSIDYSKDMWSFDRYFTSFQIVGRDLLGNTLNIKEPGAINRVTRFTYSMTGTEVERKELNPIILLNADAQTYAYFIRPPALLVPLPLHLITYGNTWQEHVIDTIPVRDTVNVGITEGKYIYNVDRTYRLDRLMDSVGSNTAMIVAENTGTFEGTQSNTVTGITVNLHGPVTGVDTIYLDLFSGRMMQRNTSLTVPVTVETEGRSPLEDVLEVRRTMILDESNAVRLRE
jgi:hypothetical protein